MNQWDSIRQLARQKRAELEAISTSNTASEVLSVAAQVTQINTQELPADDSLLNGADAVLDLDVKMIWCNSEIASDILDYYKAHEFAHFWLENQSFSCASIDLEARLAEEKSPFGVDRVENYNPKERREAQANVFAREFLLPALTLRTWFLDEHWSAAKIAKFTGVPESVVFRQLTDTLLLPSSDEPPEKKTNQPISKDINLDPSQKNAAHASNGPLLVEAGPGTGKTHTLVGRVVHLISERGVNPNEILVLTFSNKAAEEMRQRVAEVFPDQASQIWMGTFHSFGLELLRKYGYAIGLSDSPKLLDPVAALFLMEQLVPDLNLDHYLNLYDPLLPLRDILGAISRAKDELIDPEEYMHLANQMVEKADSDETIETAQKAVEVAHVYTTFQARLDREHLLDFGDLIFKSVQLFTQHSDIAKDVQLKYRHVLVDEYQDVNRACALLLQGVSGDGSGLWVVGDARQSIYRFRGAAPRNMQLFPKDFPGAVTVSLNQNYRTQPVVLNTFSALAKQMPAISNLPFSEWEPDREQTDGIVLMEVADDLDAEGYGIAKEIHRQHDLGVDYCDQAILCRSHTSLARIAAMLEQHGVPILYIGDLFEREEIRDLLSLIALASGDYRSIVRIAHFPQYQIPADDVRRIISLASENNLAFPHALSQLKDTPEISENGRRGLGLLNRHLQDICFGRGAWSFLAHYIFNRSNYLRPFLEENTLATQQQCLAIYQFLQFVYDQERFLGKDDNIKSRLLDYIRRLEIFGDEKQLRQIPEVSQNIDAVRMLTIHASKGLEFRSVYLPILGSSYFPSRSHPNPCPPPVGMLTLDLKEAHEQEEVCLFFVALSRAKDFLCLSRAERYSSYRTSKPSKLLSLIAPALQTPIDGPVTWHSDATKEETTFVPEAPISNVSNHPYNIKELDQYIICPKQYYYEAVLGLPGKNEDSTYLHFHLFLYDILGWIREHAYQNIVVNESALRDQMDAVWETVGLTGHPFEALYQKKAQEMLARALSLHNQDTRIVKSEPIALELQAGSVTFMPDQIEVRPDNSRVFRRIRTGKLSSSELDKNIYAIYQTAAEQTNSIVFPEVFSLTSGEIQPITLTDRRINTRLERYNQAIIGIQNKDFQADPSDRFCPRCPHYFICPLIADF